MAGVCDRHAWKGVWLAVAGLLALAGATAAPPEPEVRLPRDIVFDREIGPDQAVVFRHWTHVEHAAGSCLPCHPAPFKLLHPERKADHATMDAGGSCGACHDARRAFGTAEETACERCHVGAPAPASAAPARAGELRIAGTDSPGPVVFSHAAHRGTGQGCGGCHPDLFAARAGGSAGGAAVFHERCGTCHDGHSACAVEDACETCHDLTGGAP